MADCHIDGGRVLLFVDPGFGGGVVFTAQKMAGCQVNRPADNPIAVVASV